MVIERERERLPLLRLYTPALVLKAGQKEGQKVSLERMGKHA